MYFFKDSCVLLAYVELGFVLAEFVCAVVVLVVGREDLFRGVFELVFVSLVGPGCVYVAQGFQVFVVVFVAEHVLGDVVVFKQEFFYHCC